MSTDIEALQEDNKKELTDDFPCHSAVSVSLENSMDSKGRGCNRRERGVVVRGETGI